MKKIPLILPVLIALCIGFPAVSGERTIPVDIYLMIDKSLSMAEEGKYDSLHTWVQDQLIDQILIDGDWITIYEFYGKTNRLLTMTVSGAADRVKITKTIGGIHPDGQYTDIGLALDTIKNALDERKGDNRHKIMLLLTDLKQEAPWTSRYAGKQDSFNSPYLVEARQVKHDDWYEITLDMDIKDSVIETTKELYASILEQGTTTPREVPPEGEERLADSETESGNVPGSPATAGGNSAEIAKKGSLPVVPLVVLLSGICIVSLILVPVAIRSRRKKNEQAEKTV